MQPRWEANVANLIKREPHEMTVDSLTFSIKAMLEELFKVGSEEAARKIVNEIGWMVEMQAEYVACVKDESVTLARALRAMESELREAVADKLLFQDSLVELEDLETALEEYYWTDHPAVRALVQRIQEDVEEVMADEYYDRHIETTADDMAAYVAQITGLGHSDCMTFARAIIDGDVTTPEARYWDRETFAKVLLALAEKYKGIK